MREETIEVGEPLRVHFEVDELNLLNLGLLSWHLHTIMNQVAVTLFQARNEEMRAEGKSPMLESVPQSASREAALVRATIGRIKGGSLDIELAGRVSAVFSQPGAATVVHKLFSNALWAIANYATKTEGVAVRWIKGQEEAFDAALMRPIGGRRPLKQKIEKFINTLSESAKGGKLTLSTPVAGLEIVFVGGQPKGDEDDGIYL